MAVSVFNWSPGAPTAGGGSKTQGSPGATNAGDLLFAYVVSQGAQGTITVTDNHPDGLGTYTKVADILDNATTSQLSIFVRNAQIGTTSASVPSYTHVTPAGAGGSGAQVALIRGLNSGVAGLSAIRQHSEYPNQAASSSPTATFNNANLLGNAVNAFIFEDSTAQNIAAPAGWSGQSAVTLASPAMYFRQFTNTAVSGNSYTLGTTPTATYVMSWVEFVFTPEPVYLSRLPDWSQFPKGGNW